MNWNTVLFAALDHLRISFLGVAAACAVGLPLSALLVGRPKLQKAVFFLVDGLQTVPTLAMLTFLMLLFGLNATTVVACIFLYSLFPVLRNTYVGLCAAEPGTLRAGRGIGMTELQLFTRVRFPIAAPMILAGVRLAVVSALGIATTGVFIGAGGLGMLIWRGIQTRNTAMMLSGAVPVSVLALLFETLLGRAEKALVRHVPQERKNEP